jgi:hypothetical protein
VPGSLEWSLHDGKELCVFSGCSRVGDEEDSRTAYQGYSDSGLYGIPDKMRGDNVMQGKVLLLLPNLLPHPVSFHKTVLVFLNCCYIILFSDNDLEHHIDLYL